MHGCRLCFELCTAFPTLFVDHPEYYHEFDLSPTTQAELLRDLRDGG